MSKLKIGDTVKYNIHGEKGEAKVETISICQAGEKYGKDAQSVDWSRKANIVVDLSNSKWAYGSQISPK